MKYLFIGLGSIGLRHLGNLRKITDSPIIAYRSKVDTLIDKKYDIKTYLDLDKAFKEKPDVAFITNPTSKHMYYAMLCAKKGCDLFIEKPIHTRAFFVDKLFRYKKKIFVGYNYRFYPDLHEIKNTVFDVLYAQLQMGQSLVTWHPDEDYRKSYSACKKLGGGVLLTLSHDIDLAYWLFGEIKTVYAHLGKISNHDIDVEDIASIIMETTSGIVVEIHLDYLHPLGYHTIKIVNADKIVERNLNDRKKRDQTFVDELKHFLRYINDEVPPMVTEKEIIDVMKIIDACRESSHLGKKVYL